MKPIQEIFAALEQPKKVVITTHQKPDPDAMGSVLALKHFLEQFSHPVTVISPTNWAHFLNWMHGAAEVLDFESHKDRAAALKAVQEAEWIFCLDHNVLARTKNLEQPIKEAAGVKILIDHHQQPDVQTFQYGVSDTSKSSTCEMVYDFIVQSGHVDKINTSIAECLYAGVIGDTGSFRFPAASAGVHRMVAVLKEKGLSHTRVHENIYDNFLENRLRFIGHVLLNKMEVMYEYNAALIHISKQELQRFDIKPVIQKGW